MKCTIIDKTPYDAYIELPDGMIVSVPVNSVESKSIGETTTVQEQYLYNNIHSQNIRFDKIIDFF